MPEKKSLAVAYLLACTPVLGWSGAHRLYLGHLPEVWMYSETMGGFLFAWLRDLVRMRRLVAQTNVQAPENPVPAGFSRSELLGVFAAAWIGVVPKLTLSFPPTRFMAGQQSFLEKDALDAATRDSHSERKQGNWLVRKIQSGLSSVRRLFGPQIRFGLLESAFGALLAANSAGRTCSFLGVWAGALAGMLVGAPVHKLVQLTAQRSRLNSTPLVSAVEYGTLIGGRALGATLATRRLSTAPGSVQSAGGKYSRLETILTRGRFLVASLGWINKLLNSQDDP